ncbi:Uncharacterized protein APZ42_031288 [Daphnia magna]|uniref:Uncharacterized protein n=1 Tax=Daphnia magna TaxID=35525 RepID=A0A162DBV1_9CRUS|nr:Uncharacterized protein APZ42_031288 [Daphnia magna]
MVYKGGVATLQLKKISKLKPLCGTWVIYRQRRLVADLELNEEPTLKIY